LSEEYDLKKSENKIGQLYPILKSKDGQIIDGFHRQKADPNWKSLVVPEIDSEEKLLLARLIANFHRRQVSREEKEEWINGLAEIYKKQGLKVRLNIGSEHENQIKNKIVEITGLSKEAVEKYLLAEFKQEQTRPSESYKPLISASQRIEAKLGSEIVDRFRKQVLEEAKLTPQERDALTKKREHEKEERQRKRVENKRLKDEKLQKQAEETAKQKLLKDKDFIADVAKLAPLREGSEVQEESEPAISENSQQLTSFLTNYAKALKKNPYPQVETDEVQTAINFFKRLLAKDKIHCPICGETHLQWGCGHEF
jgi:phosphotransferase system IIB component